MSNKIDLVVPYVDGSDPVWQKVFNHYSPKVVNQNVNGNTRFRGQGNFFRYFFRCIEKNMPWINHIFLLVQSESQVPNWINRSTVTVVTHDKFIPAEFLPVFNSCAIEMFLHNIPGLSEQFIYANDDLYVVKSLTPERFFSTDKVRFETINQTSCQTMYTAQCKHGYELIFGKSNSFYRLPHSFRPMLRSKNIECFNLYEAEILDSVSRFREQKNFNCYIFPLYLKKLGLQLPADLRSGYSTITTAGKIDRYLDTHDTVCLNDAFDSNIYDNEDVKVAFAERFSKKSKYELTDWKYPVKKRTSEYYLYF